MLKVIQEYERDMHKNAIKYGDAYVVEILGTRRIKKATYVILASLNGERIKIGEYSSDPANFLPKFRKCRVYHYKKKYYLEELYEQPLEIWKTLTPEDLIAKYSAQYMANCTEHNVDACVIRRRMDLGVGSRVLALGYNRLHTDNKHYYLYYDIFLEENQSDIYRLRRILYKKLYAHIEDINYERYHMTLEEAKQELCSKLREWMTEFDSGLRVRDIVIAAREFEVVQYKDQI